MKTVKIIASSIVIFGFAFLLTACSQEKEKKKGDESKVEAKEKTIEEDKKVVIPKAASTVEEMVNQAQGQLMDEIVNQDLDGKSSWEGMNYINYYKDTFQPKSNEVIADYVAKQKDMSADEIYDYLVYMLGSGQYKDFYPQLENYDSGYVMPDLPQGPDEVADSKKKTNIVILLDASGSMKASVPGGVKMDLAKNAIATFAASLPPEANTSLLVYGHEGTGSDADKALSCGKIEAKYPLQPYKPNEFQESMKSFKASGWTPLAEAINKANEVLKPYDSKEYDNKVYIVSDGIETCDGDPVLAAKNLQNSNIEAKVNIIGFDVDNEGQKQLKQISEAGAGEFISVKNQAELEAQVQKKWAPSIGQIVWTQGVNMQQYIAAHEKMNNIYNPLYHFSKNEQLRLQNVMYHLQSEKLVNDDVYKPVMDLINQRHDLRSEYFKSIKEAKLEEAKQLENEIKEKVKAWKEQWK